jgi:hypothetical protein
MNNQFKQQLPLPPIPAIARPRKRKDEAQANTRLTFPAAALAVVRPVGERGAALPRSTPGPRRIVPGDDLDPQNPVGEVDRVEGELKARTAARPREVRVHVRTPLPPSCRSNQPIALSRLASLLTQRCCRHRLTRRNLAKP